MSAESGAERPKAPRPQRSAAGNVAFGAGVLLVLATATLGAFAAVALLGRAVDPGPLSNMVPDDGHNALIVGGIAAGGLTGLMLPVILFGMVRGNEDTPRVGPAAAARKVLAVLVFDVLLLVVSLLAAQLGWFLPGQLTTVVAVFAVGFSWMPLAMVPWERLGLGDGFGKLRGPSASRQAQ
ncbi:hypothetical protein [Streptomyces lomondensis]|uniref:Integral membrane protein n=1 Tax=Streptomyces lomondensis TaxID=68229 RepID=A0ABQ2WUY0_9ACTN|nr:hypothetical protein [Streptomyces lomondensis]MCF0078413.1 hypothetical protein [Streptomyces lomondensis]GGW77354.1 hypothetical protein GCM10010383_00660 [Streptomyces lomondensis]